MKIQLYNLKAVKTGFTDLPSEIFGFKREELNHDLMHQAVVAQMANARQVIAHTKLRPEKRGGGRKPWRQKGTGRARHGSIRSPIWKGGGVTFGPRKNKNFSKKLNKKMKRKALFMAISSKVLDNELIMVDTLNLSEAKTRLMTKALNNLLGTKLVAPQRKQASKDKKIKINSLIVLPGKNENIVRACMNIPKVQVIRADSLNIRDVL
ncbi:50S ribosomal protein L4, partial [bacterium]|nr:50S ribosomal protein L4 [bacterium]